MADVPYYWTLMPAVPQFQRTMMADALPYQRTMIAAVLLFERTKMAAGLLFEGTKMAAGLLIERTMMAAGLLLERTMEDAGLFEKNVTAAVQFVVLSEKIVTAAVQFEKNMMTAVDLLFEKNTIAVGLLFEETMVDAGLLLEKTMKIVALGKVLMAVVDPYCGILMAVAYYENLVAAAQSSEEILIVFVLTLDGLQRTVILKSEVHLKLIFPSMEKALMATHLPFE